MAVVLLATLMSPAPPAGAANGSALASKLERPTGGLPGPSLQGPAVAVAHHEGGTFDFNGGWRFALVNRSGEIDPADPFANAAVPAFDDSGWRAIHVPHDWSIEGNPSPGPNTTAATGFYEGGLGWYRKTFTLPPAMAGKSLSIEFDGVYMDSQVYLNGTLLGGHHYGYTGFSFDLGAAHTDGRTPNVLAVRVRNQIPSGRWYAGSGIYRNVRLIATDPVHVRRHGMVVTTPELERTAPAGYAAVRVATTVDATGTVRPVRIISTVRDGGGRPVGSASTTVSTGSAPVTAALDVRVARPRLWSVSDPYLYSVTTQLMIGDRVVDSYLSRTGFRWARFDPQAGFLLNGRPLKLRGVNMHHDLGALGAAVNYDALLRQLTIMKSMGVNALRTSHNPPAPELVQVCEQLGIVMQVEAFDVWTVAKAPYDYARFFPADGEADIAEMVKESRNSPAVIMWSIGNEIWDLRAVPDPVPTARRLIDAVRAEDPTRPVVMGADQYRSVPATGSVLDRILRMHDGMGLNYNTAGSVDGLHAKYPDKFFFEAESSSQTSTRGQYDQPEQLNTGENHTPGRRAASSYDNNLASWTMSAEYALKKDRDRPWFLGQFLWSGFDYLGEPTPYDVFPVKSSLFGAVDTAGFAKDQYYLFKSQWNPDPMVHLVPMDWTDHKLGEPVQVWAYSNVESVELFLNGRSVGVRTFDRKVTADGRGYLETTEATGDDKNVKTGAYPGSYTGSDGTAGHLRLTWNVPFEPGKLVAVARSGGTVVARDELRTAGAPAAIRLSADRKTMLVDGRSLAFVTAEVVDRHGVVVPGAENLLHFSAKGGRLVGVDSGRQETAESYKAPHRTAFHGKALVIATPTGGRNLTVTAASTGLRSGSASVSVRTAPANKRGVVSPAQGAAPVTWFTPGAPTSPVPGTTSSTGLTADASFSGTESTQPAWLVDGHTATGMWSNTYVKGATGLLPQISAARRTDWASLRWSPARELSGVTASFVVDAQRALPATVTVSTFDGQRWRPATGVRITWATGTNQPTRITFDPVTATALRLDLASSRPQMPSGFIGITELTPLTPSAASFKQGTRSNALR